jgi:hypothetical protein
MDSILTSVKKLLGIAEEYTHFDSDIIMHINTVFSSLTQMGVGPAEGFAIVDEYAIWDEFTSENTSLAAVKTYMYLKVRLLFDPPQNSSVMSSMERQASELEWRLNLTGETLAEKSDKEDE